MPIEDVFSDLMHRSADGIDAPTGLVAGAMARGRARRRRTTIAAAAAGAALTGLAVAGIAVGLSVGDDRSEPPVVEDPTPSAVQRVPVSPARGEELLVALVGDGLDVLESGSSPDDGALSVRGVYDGGQVAFVIYEPGPNPPCDPGRDDGCTRVAGGRVLVSTPGPDAHAEDEFNRATYWTDDGWVVMATAHENDESVNQAPGADHWAVLEHDVLQRVVTSEAWFVEKTG